MNNHNHFYEHIAGLKPHTAEDVDLTRMSPKE